MRLWTTVLGSCVLLVNSLSGFTQAALVTLNPAADVNTKFNDTVGNGANIDIKNDTGGTNNGQGNTRKGYIRYDLNGVNVPNVVDASISFTLAATPSLTNQTVWVYGLMDATPTNGNNRYGDVAWTEAQAIANWSVGNHVDAPANSFDSSAYIGNGSGATGFNGLYTDPLNTALGSFNVTSSNPAGTVFTLSGLNLLNFIQNDTNGTLTFMLYVTPQFNSSFVSIAATEHATLNPPQLLLTVVPEPASLGLAALAAIGLIGMLLRRRRK